MSGTKISHNFARLLGVLNIAFGWDYTLEPDMYNNSAGKRFFDIHCLHRLLEKSYSLGWQTNLHNEYQIFNPIATTLAPHIYIFIICIFLRRDIAAWHYISFSWRNHSSQFLSRQFTQWHHTLTQWNYDSKQRTRAYISHSSNALRFYIQRHRQRIWLFLHQNSRNGPKSHQYHSWRNASKRRRRYGRIFLKLSRFPFKHALNKSGKPHQHLQ